MTQSCKAVTIPKLAFMLFFGIPSNILASSDTLANQIKPAVLNGADQILSEEYFQWIRNKRIGIIAHGASRTSDGQHLVDLLYAQKETDLRIIFSPEHGLRAQEDNPIPDYTDPVTGLPVYSLYGPRRAPEPQQLELSRTHLQHLIVCGNAVARRVQ